MNKKIANKKSLVALFIALLFFAIFNNHITSASLTSEQTVLIKNNCLSAKSSLNQLHASDALSRVNSGQIYESLGTKLMEKFNARLSNNGYGNSTMVSITENFKILLNTFRQDYMSYENQVVRALGIDCSSQPVAFYNAITEANLMRQKVFEDTSRLDQYIREYEQAVEKFKLDYKVISDEN